jgi:hypothetical protein
MLIAVLALAGCGGDSGSSNLSDAGTGTSGEQEALCRPGDRVVVSIFVDAPGELAHGMHTRLYYPRSMDIPGRLDDRSVIERVAFVVTRPNGSDDLPEEAFVNGLVLAVDEDSNQDGVDERVNALLGSPVEPFSDGKFVDVTLDCVESIPWPSTQDFRCEVADVTSTEFVSVGVESICWVEVAPPAAG